MSHPKPTAQWTCLARPAALGRTCGHANATGHFYAPRALLCCEACGATKKASDDRDPALTRAA